MEVLECQAFDFGNVWNFQAIGRQGDMKDTRGRLPEISGTLWIADGVGLIKQVEDDPALGLLPDKSTMELVEKK